MAKKYPRNRPCPCGSGKKYKNCCYGKDFDWVEDRDGSIGRAVPMGDEVAAALKPMIPRDAKPDDLLFKDAPAPEEMERGMVRAMREAGIHPAKIYAFEKTGLMLSQDNIGKVPDLDIEAWEQAYQEYFDLHGEELKESERPPEFPIGTVAFYGPDDRTTTKVAASVTKAQGAAPIMKRWVGSDVATSPKVQRELKNFFMEHGVTNVVATEGNLGCPHEEGLDFPEGEECPFCEFWRGKRGRTPGGPEG